MDISLNHKKKEWKKIEQTFFLQFHIVVIKLLSNCFLCLFYFEFKSYVLLYLLGLLLSCWQNSQIICDYFIRTCSAVRMYLLDHCGNYCCLASSEWESWAKADNRFRAFDYFVLWIKRAKKLFVYYYQWLMLIEKY